MLMRRRVGDLIHLLDSVLPGHAAEEDMERTRSKPVYRNDTEIASAVGAKVILCEGVGEDSLPAENPK